MISNLDGLGFKQGVRITEFSNDDTMSMQIRGCKITEFAAEGYVQEVYILIEQEHYRLGTIGPGALARDGTTPATGDPSAGGLKLLTWQIQQICKMLQLKVMLM